MTEEKFKEIKDKIKMCKDRNIEAKTKMSLIQEQWKSKYGFDDLESAEKKLEEIKTDISKKTEKKNELLDKLEKSFDWEKVY